MSTDKAGRVVFIGNIPYGLTEEQITSIFSSVGQVLSFRLVYDNDTGRPKGFGFAEFADTDAAASAVRNLDKHQIMGRELRVDFSHVGGKDDAAPAGYLPQPSQPPNGYAPAPPPPQSNGLGPLPPGVDLAPGLTCPDAISKTLSTLPPPQLLDILSQMKGLVMGDPNKATELLKQAPQLSYAIFQALLLMGLVDTSVLSSVVEQAAQPVPPPAPTPLQQIPARPVQGYQPPPPQQQQPQQQQQQQYQPPPQQTPHPGYPQIPGQGYAPTPPIQQQAYQPPPQQPVPPAQQDPNALLQQVLAMPQFEVDKLPQAERQQIMQLKQQFGGRIGY
ncbi:hypothetical protein MMC19_000222 [Ptychographa xylographoides]|nr:hypothetical protein [Ptychographa xylographoides]